MDSAKDFVSVQQRLWEPLSAAVLLYRSVASPTDDSCFLRVRLPALKNVRAAKCVPKMI